MSLRHVPQVLLLNRHKSWLKSSKLRVPSKRITSIWFFSIKFRNIVALDRAMPSFVFGHTPKVVSMVAFAEHLYKLLVVCNHKQLEVLVILSGFKQSAKSLGQTLNVSTIQRERGLIQSQNATVQTEGFSQRKANDQGGQHLLASTAAASHIQLNSIFEHDNTIVVRSSSGRRLLGTDLDRIDVTTLVDGLPEFFDDFVDLTHLLRVELHQCTLQGLLILLEIAGSKTAHLNFDQHALILLLNVAKCGTFQPFSGFFDTVQYRRSKTLTPVSLAAILGQFYLVPFDSFFQFAERISVHLKGGLQIIDTLLQLDILLFAAT
mmetsp:Transcript_19969/g.50704  ORF Transcript_19969/g.50704 Transcript_19969/m.50704 type:complete len:320 (-) Transcript_19969:2300-3259(-)